LKVEIFSYQKSLLFVSISDTISDMKNLSEQIISTLTRKGSLTASEIATDVGTNKINVNRCLVKLLDEHKVTRRGNGRSTYYQTALDPNTYFMTSIETRNGRKDYNESIFDLFANLVEESEIKQITTLNQKYCASREKLSPTLLKKEIERITIEFAWKSSQIEGNTYSLLDTERLIKESIETQGKTHEEAVMILNHKKACDYIFENPNELNKVTLDKIIKLHKILTTDLKIDDNIRNHRVGITGSSYIPLGDADKIKAELKRLCDYINKVDNPFVKALVAVLMISYIQPFEDGNKRTARTIGNAILLANGFCPISYRSVADIEYKKAIVLFYEQNDFHYFKQIFIEQFKQAVENYF